MEFEIEFYKDEKGNSPVETFLDGLKINNPLLREQLLKGFEKLKNRAYHREPVSKYLEPGLWELRVKSENNIARVVFTFRKGKIIILLHAFIKKQQKTPAGKLEIARKRLKEIIAQEVN